MINLHYLVDYKLTEKQFAQIICESRLYNYLSNNERVLLTELLMNKGHIYAIAKNYYNDESFCSE